MNAISALGLADPVFSSQTAFRHVLRAMSSPGDIVTFERDLCDSPKDVSPAAAATLLTLCDYDTPIFSGLNSEEFESWLRFYTGTHFVSQTVKAKFAVVKSSDASYRFTDFNLGDARYPDLSTTVLVECADLHGGQRVRISGPGNQVPREIAPLGLHTRYWSDFSDQAEIFPLGVDVILTSGYNLMALPRSVRVEEIF